MSPARYLSKREYDRLKAAFRELVRAVGGPNAAERITRVSHQQIVRYGSMATDFADVFAPIDVISDLEAECGNPIVSRELAEMAQHMVVPMPVLPGSTCRIDILTANAVSRFGTMLTELAEARADGKISAAEANELDPMIDDLISKLVKLKHEIAARGETEDRP
jgi:hypothetical protein